MSFFSIFVFFVAIGTPIAATISSQDVTTINTNMKYFETMLKRSATSFQGFYNTTASNFVVACNSSDYNNTINLTHGDISNVAMYDNIQVQYTNNVPSTQETNAISNLKTMFSTNLKENFGNIEWQFYASPNFYGGYPEAPINCTAPSATTEKPYYVAGVTGPKDIVILIDTSTVQDDSSTRINISKTIAKEIVKSLSYHDYVIVLTYNEFVEFNISHTLQQATLENVKILLDKIDNITIPVNRFANLGGALSKTYNILEAAKSESTTSGCTQTIVLLSGGTNDIIEIDPLSVIQNKSAIIFSFMVSSGEESRALMGRLACDTNGIFRKIISLEDGLTKWKIYNTYFATLLNNSAVRWSEVYVDDFGQGKVISSTFPIYTIQNGAQTVKGMMVLDISLANLSLNGVVSDLDINTHLFSSQVCTLLNLEEDLQSLRVIQGDTCANDQAPVEKLTAEKLLPMWVVFDVVFLIGTFVMFYFFGKDIDRIHPPEEVKWDRRINIMKHTAYYFIMIYFVSWLIATCLMFAELYDDAVAVNFFEKIEYIVERQESNPYRCCNIVNCQCVGYYGPACGQLVNNLTEGDCGNGLKCCQYIWKSCNCYQRQNCDTKGLTSCQRCSLCRDCVSSVGNEHCQVQCGTCYRPSTTVSYYYNNKRYISKFVSDCARDQHTCPTDFFNVNGPIGSKHTGYINPRNPKMIRNNNNYPMNFFVPFLIFAILTAISLVVIIVLYFFLKKPQVPKVVPVPLPIPTQTPAHAVVTIAQQKPKQMLSAIQQPHEQNPNHTHAHPYQGNHTQVHPYPRQIYGGM